VKYYTLNRINWCTTKADCILLNLPACRFKILPTLPACN
jgi:hypothetical protein